MLVGSVAGVKSACAQVAESKTPGAFSIEGEGDQLYGHFFLCPLHTARTELLRVRVEGSD